MTNESLRDWEKEFDAKGFIVYPCPECDGFGKHIDLSKTAGDRPCTTCHGLRNEPNGTDKLKSFIRNLLSQAVKEAMEGKSCEHCFCRKGVEEMQVPQDYSVNMRTIKRGYTECCKCGHRK